MLLFFKESNHIIFSVVNNIRSERYNDINMILMICNGSDNILDGYKLHDNKLTSQVTAVGQDIHVYCL